MLFSNSLIEGNNRILKQTYLKDIKLSSAELEPYITKSIIEYNSIKPHYFHKIYTPDEIFNKPELKETKLLFETLNKERMAANKAFACGKVCS